MKTKKIIQSVFVVLVLAVTNSFVCMAASSDAVVRWPKRAEMYAVFPAEGKHAYVMPVLIVEQGKPIELPTFEHDATRANLSDVQQKFMQHDMTAGKIVHLIDADSQPAATIKLGSDLTPKSCASVAAIDGTLSSAMTSPRLATGAKSSIQSVPRVVLSESVLTAARQFIAQSVLAQSHLKAATTQVDVVILRTMPLANHSQSTALVAHVTADDPAIKPQVCKTDPEDSLCTKPDVDAVVVYETESRSTVQVGQTTGLNEVDARYLEYVGVFDLEGDGVPELALLDYGYELSGLAMYRRVAGAWVLFHMQFLKGC